MSVSKLVRPSLSYKDSFFESLEEYHWEGEFEHLSKLIVETNFEDYVDTLNEENRMMHDPCASWTEDVPETVLWLVKESMYLGTVYIRHRLNWHLEKDGGHVYIIIRPDQRHKGYGKRALKLSLTFANTLGIEKVLLTIEPENIIARHLAENFGAGPDKDITQTGQFKRKCRYWLNTD